MGRIGSVQNFFRDQRSRGILRAVKFFEICYCERKLGGECRGLVEGKEELKLFAPLGCGLQTGAASVLNRAQAKKGDSVAVIGLGGVGMAAIMVVFSAGD